MTNKNINEYEPLLVSHPGETLLDILDEKSMPQAELARRTGRPVKTINEIIRGKASITSETALQLERVLGVPASFWLKRQYNYDEYIARFNENAQIDLYKDWAKKFPLKKMIEYGYIPDSKSTIEHTKSLLGMFKIASPEVFDRNYLNAAIRYRKSAQFTTDEYALAAWLQFGRIQASVRHCSLYNKINFKKRLPSLRSLTTEPPEIFVPKLESICAECGVAVVFVPELPKIRAFGATYWEGVRPVIQLCLRGKRDDILWFTFFHEAAHILLHQKKNTIFLDAGKAEGKEEEEADRFASELLLSKKELVKFVDNNPLTYDSIETFARQKGLAPSIIVGKLHHFGYAPFKHFQKLRKTFIWDYEK